MAQRREIFVKCDICDRLFCPCCGSSKFHKICFDCANIETLKRPLKLINDVINQNSFAGLSSFQKFEIHISGVLDTIKSNNYIIQELRADLKTQFQLDSWE